MENFSEIIVGLLSFSIGVVLDRIHVNAQRDDERRQRVVAQVDEIIENFHLRFSDSPSDSQFVLTLLDYKIRSLVDDTTLLHIIGRSIFDGEYTRLIGKIYQLTAYDPKDFNDMQRQDILSTINSHGIDLKKIINVGARGWRLINRQ